MKPLIQDEKTNEKPYHEELAPAGGPEGNNKGNSKLIKVLKDGDLASSMGDENSIGAGSFASGGNRTSGSFAGTNRSSGGNKSSFNENNAGRVSFGDGGNKTSFSNNNTSFRSSYNGK